MAIYTNGTKSKEVLDLQRELNAAGYNLAEDSIYGPKTDAAYKDYQAKQSAVNTVVGVGPGEGVSANVSAGPAISSSSSSSTKKYGTKLADYPDYSGPTSYGGYEDYTPSGKVRDYYGKMMSYEGQKPEWESQYEPQIQSILDNILNKKEFSIADDKNYQQLYDAYSQGYQAQASRAMRDSMAQAQAASGGYGNTYAQAVGQQAYDRTMEGMNDQNMALMQMARQMYDTDRADTYNQLNAFQGADQIDYGRYRDDVGDYYTDRDYYTNLYNNERNFDYGRYVDDRNFDYDQFTNDRNFAYNQYADDRAYNAQAYEMEENEYNDALSQALAFAKQGISIPNRLKARLGSDANMFDGIYAQALAGKSSGSGSGKGKGTTESKDGGNEGDEVLYPLYNTRGKNAKDANKNVVEWYTADTLADMESRGEAMAMYDPKTKKYHYVQRV